MSIFRSKGEAPTIKQRPSVLIKIRMVKRAGESLDASEAWEALKNAFKYHAELDVFQAEIRPDKERNEET